MFAILSFSQKSSDIYSVKMSDGFSYLLRLGYCDVEFFDLTELNDEQYEAIVFASQCFAAEQDAMKYLSMAEHSEFNLLRKLRKKGHSSKAAVLACSYLKDVGDLSDFRFAEAFLRNRSINHNEGRVRLLAELKKRGIASCVAEKAVSRFFQEQDEEGLLCKEIFRLKQKKVSNEKIIAALVRKGFSLKQVLMQVKNN